MSDPDPKTKTSSVSPAAPAKSDDQKPGAEKPPREIGGPTGPEPTRYGDWERNGRCTDF